MSLLSIGLVLTYFNCIFAACPPGWIAGTSSSSCYLFNQKSLNWLSASHFCRSEGAHLVRVDSVDEMNFIKNEIDLLPGQYWLDGVDDVVEGDWRWASTYSRIETKFWYPGEPNQNSRSENCMETASRYHGLWNDEDCGNHQYSICEKETVQ
ncbi:C-type lectin domain family 17, member A-like [Mytilus edulis]|uniref:C-type lectin domain family 17, member A-like n=1 Tax=Mytilus edulis TaxID=6550 RepID=UPI0039EFF7A0